MSKQSSKFFLVTRNCIDSFLDSFREASHLTGQQRNRAPVLLQGRGCLVARQDVPALACTLACSSVCCVLVHALVSEQTDSCDSRHGNFSPRSGELHVGGRERERWWGEDLSEERVFEWQSRGWRHERTGSLALATTFFKFQALQHPEWREV